MLEVTQHNPLTLQKEKIEKNLSGVKKIIGVYSAKGGVGKTTVAINFAALLAKKYSVGLLDADIDCPDVGINLGLSERLEKSEGKIIPLNFEKMKIVSTAFINDSEKEPLILRGPLKHHVLMQFLELVEWGNLDYLIIDMPPGTSDVPLSLMEFIKMEIIFVTTPQRQAVLDVERSINMVKSFNMPILGIVENMSGDVFGSGLSKKIAKDYSLEFLGSIKLEKSIREISEKGKIPVIELPEIEKQFLQIMEKLKI